MILTISIMSYWPDSSPCNNLNSNYSKYGIAIQSYISSGSIDLQETAADSRILHDCYPSCLSRVISDSRYSNISHSTCSLENV